MDYRNMSKQNFPAITSQPNRPATWALRLLLWIVVIAVFFSIYAIPTAFAFDPYYSSNWGIIVIIYLILLVLTAWLIKLIRTQKKNTIVEIVVDEKGMHRKRFNGSIDSILYKDLQKNTNPYEGGDIYVVTPRRSPPMLRLIKLSIETTAMFTTDITYSYFTGNMFELRAHFIKGIQIFRPDLKIADDVFEKFYINRDDFSFDKKSYRKTILLVVILLLIIVACFAWYDNMH